jgi:hypothetical protein
MLAPDSRTVLIDQLRPPVGYRLDAAVATTFTLDLTAALIPPLAFASFEIRGVPDPIAVLEAVRSCADRVDVFCQAGQIRVPTQASDLMAYLEPMVHEVTPARRGFLFHPKLWFLRYVADGLPEAFRLLVLTRNLTPDRSWDAVVRLDGQRGGHRRATNSPVAVLLAHLPSLAVTPLPRARLARLAELKEDARRVVWDVPDDVRELAFHLWGVPSQSRSANFTGFRHLVVSPFCNDKGLDQMFAGSSEATLVSRVDDLECLPPDTLSGLTSCRVLDPTAGLTDPSSVEGPASQNLFDGLHAKLVVVERNRWAHVFVGSANATSAALGGNVEFMVELTGSTTTFGVAQFLDADAGLGSLLIDYSAEGGRAPDPADEARRALESALRNLACVPFTVRVTGAEGSYESQVTTAVPVPVPPEHRATVELLTRPGQAGELCDGRQVDTTITGIPLADITPFVVVTLTSPTGLAVGTVVRALLVNDPSDRLDAVLARQVDTPEKFLRFLALLLGLTDPTTLFDASGNGLGGTSTFGANGSGPGILELVMRALADQPASLHDLDRLVQRLSATEHGRAVMPAGFESLWGQVLLALAQRSEVLQ